MARAMTAPFAWFEELISRKSPAEPIPPSRELRVTLLPITQGVVP